MLGSHDLSRILMDVCIYYSFYLIFTERKMLLFILMLSFNTNWLCFNLNGFYIPLTVSDFFHVDILCVLYIIHMNYVLVFPLLWTYVLYHVSNTSLMASCLVECWQCVKKQGLGTTIVCAIPSFTHLLWLCLDGHVVHGLVCHVSCMYQTSSKLWCSRPFFRVALPWWQES